MSHLMSTQGGFRQGRDKVNNNENTNYIEKSKVHLFEKLFDEIAAKVGGRVMAMERMKVTKGLSSKLNEKRLSANYAKRIIDAHNKIVKGKYVP